MVMKCEKWTDQHDVNVGQRKKTWVPDRNWTRDLPNTGWVLYPLSYKTSPFLFTYHAHNDFDSADPGSMQDTCHIRTQFNDLGLPEFS